MIKDSSYGSEDYLLNVGIPLTEVVVSVPEKDKIVYKAYFEDLVDVVFIAENNSHDLYYTLDAMLSVIELPYTPDPLDATTFVAIPEGSALWHTADVTVANGNTRQFCWEDLVADNFERHLCDPGLN